jgi:hypothetical protein
MMMQMTKREREGKNMEAKLLKPRLEIVEKLVANAEASQNFIESILNDIPETRVHIVSDIEVMGFSDNSITAKASADYPLIDGVVFKFIADGVKCEMSLVIESVGFMKWWHDKSFFCDKFYRLHYQTNDNVKRFATFLITDMNVKASSFHTISRFNNKDGIKNDSFIIHDLVAAKETGNEENELENWIRALVESEQKSNVSNITDAHNFRVA